MTELDTDAYCAIQETLQAAQEHEVEQDLRAAARDLEAEQPGGRPLVFFGLSAPMPF